MNMRRILLREIVLALILLTLVADAQLGVPPLISIQPTTSTVCGGSRGQTTASITVSPSSTTIYSVTGTNSRGCSRTASVTAVVGSSIMVTATASPTSICAGGSSTLTASGATFLY